LHGVVFQFYSFPLRVRKSYFAPGLGAGGKSVAIRARSTGRIPAMIGLGLVLTLAWSGSLLWLFVRMILALV